MAIRLIATDMDGTLLTGLATYGIPPENAAAIREAQAAGIVVALASGRMSDDAGFYAIDAGLSMPVIGLNGGTIAMEPLGSIFYSQPMNISEARKLTALALESGMLFALFGAKRLWVSREERQLDHIWGGYIGRDGSDTQITAGSETLEAMFAEGVHKLVIIDEQETGRLPALRERCLAAVPDCSITSSWYNNIEINPHGVDKGKALSALAAHLDIPMEEVMALGDNDNDIAMLDAAGLSVAMGNASPAARKASDYITLSCEAFGFAAAVRALALGIPQDGVVPV